MPDLGALRERLALHEELARQRARDSFMAYMKATTPGYRASPVHYEMAEALEAVERGEIPRLLLTVPVRHGKTLMVGRRFGLWYMARNPGRDVMLCSYGGDLAKKSGRALRNLARDPRHLAIFPEARLSGDSGAAEYWTLETGGEFICAGTSGPIMGSGFHLGICDDLLKGREAANSPVQRDAVWEWFEDDFLTRAQHPHALIMVSARWHLDDPPGRLLERMEAGGEQWHVINYPALDEDDSALAPDLIPAEQLLNVRANRPARTWMSLYMGQPIPDSGDFFSAEWFKPSPVKWTPEEAEAGLVRVYAASDYAVTASDAADFTVHVIVAVDPDDNWHVVDMWRGRTTPDVWANAMIGLAAKWRPLMWAEGAGGLQKAVNPYIAKRMAETGIHFARRQIPETTDKATRALSFQGHMAVGKVFWDYKAPWFPTAQAELLRFDAHRHDDIVDSLSLIGKMCAGMAQGRPPPRPFAVEEQAPGTIRIRPPALLPPKTRQDEAREAKRRANRERACAFLRESHEMEQRA